MSDVLSDYRKDIDTFLEVNTMVKHNPPSRYAKDAVRGNDPILTMVGKKNLSSIYHRYLRQWGFKMGSLVELGDLNHETRNRIDTWRGLNIQYKNKVAKPLLDMFEDVHGKGSATPSKSDSSVRGYPQFKHIQTMIDIMEVKTKKYDKKKLKKLKRNYDQFNSDYSVFMNYRLAPILDKPQKITLYNKVTKEQKNISNFMLDIRRKDDQHRDYNVSETSILNYLLMLKQGSAAFADFNVICPELNVYMARRTGSFEKIGHQFINHMNKHKELQNKPILDVFRQALQDIRLGVVKEFDRKDLAVFKYGDDYISSSLEMLGIYNDFTAEELDVSDYVERLRREKELREAEAEKAFINMVFGNDNNDPEDQPKPRSQSGGCPFGFGR